MGRSNQKRYLKWEQSCDFSGWNTAPIKQLAIQALPANLFLSPSGKIEGKNMSEEDIKKKLEEIEQKEKRRKRVKRNSKKQTEVAYPAITNP